MKKKVLVIGLLISVLLLTGCDLVGKVQEANKEVNAKEELTPVDDNKETRYDLYEHDKIKIVYDSGKILVTAPELYYKEEKIQIGVKSAVLVHVGQSDICEGNARLIFIMNDGSLSSLYIDDLVCGNKLRTNSYFDGLTNIVEVYDKKVKTNDYEPYKYSVYAKDSKGNETDISKYLN